MECAQAWRFQTPHPLTGRVIRRMFPRGWRKIHLGIDEETLEVRAVEVTSSNIGDAPMLPELLNQIPPDQDIGSVTADGAYDTRKCHEAGCSCSYPATQECKALEAYERRSNCPQRCGQCTTVPGPHGVAALERIPPSKPRRNEDALYETTRPSAHGEGLRKAGRGNPNPHRRAEPLHRYWYTCNGVRRISSLGKGEEHPLTDLCNKAPISELYISWTTSRAQECCKQPILAIRGLRRRDVANMNRINPAQTPPAVIPLHRVFDSSISTLRR